MPTYQRFEDLPVWQTAARLYEGCDDFLAVAPPSLRSSTRNQLERAVLSVSNNIAEGFERGTTNELLAFIYIARGSAGEVRSMLLLFSRRPWISDFRFEDPDFRLEGPDFRLEVSGFRLEGPDFKFESPDIALD
jgi:four helix bundle protein